MALEKQSNITTYLKIIQRQAQDSKQKHFTKSSGQTRQIMFGCVFYNADTQIIYLYSNIFDFSRKIR